ncbi:MAG: DUF3419 family protein [Bacteroidia bacterium]
METEFRHLSFDQIRYAMVWEGAASLRNGLQAATDDQLLVITSGGCNVMNMLLSDCKQVTAVDLNPLQNRLLELKGRIIARLPYTHFSGLMGFEGPSAVKQAQKAVMAILMPEERDFWKPIFENSSTGLLLAGRLETYINGFYNQLNEEQRRLMQLIFDAHSLSEQQHHFELLLQTPFKEVFVNYFNRQQLRKGRDERLFKYTRDPGGESFFARLCRYMEHKLLGQSFISRFFFYGPENMPQALRPACYQEQNYTALAKAWSKLRIHTGEAIEFLCSPAGQHINKASLSNIFEYTSPEIFERTLSQLLERPHLRFMYWNLLNDQGGKLREMPAYLRQISAQLSLQEDCFYFDSLHIFDTQNPNP